MLIIRYLVEYKEYIRIYIVSMPFVDKCKILIKAGNGGDGIVSWRREAHVPLGGPAGGNGGNGGNVYFVGDRNETSLDFLHYQKKIIAKNGENGGIKNMYGHNADDVYVKVPLGTVVKKISTDEIIADITINNEKYLIAQGGQGGHGNAFFKSGKNKAPTLYERGEKGESFEVILELKQISDIGLIGLPNAGKSSLISCLTNAKPKIADYQFTTLTPALGALDNNGQKIIIADIPGLIAGASQGLGLGHEFLRHIERCKILCHVVSLSNNDNEDIIAAMQTIFNELKLYNQQLLDKKIIIIANKCDEPEAEENFKKIMQTFTDYPIFKTSCLTDEGLEQLKAYFLEITQDKLMHSSTTNKQLLVFKHAKETSKEETLNKTVTINCEKAHIYDVTCEYLQYWTYRIPINTPDNLIRLNQKIANTTMMSQLENMGIQEGDTIRIYEVSFNYEK